jgi:hypothetical protein
MNALLAGPNLSPSAFTLSDCSRQNIIMQIMPGGACRALIVCVRRRLAVITPANKAVSQACFAAPAMADQYLRRRSPPSPNHPRPDHHGHPRHRHHHDLGKKDVRSNLGLIGNQVKASKEVQMKYKPKTLLRDCYSQVLGPRCYLPKFTDCLCRHSDAWVCLHPHLSRQATKSYLEGGNASDPVDFSPKAHAPPRKSTAQP